MNIVADMTRKGFPALWEEGGAVTSSGDARIICGLNGEKLRPVYVTNRGPRANGRHGLFIVKAGDHIIHASQSRGMVERICVSVIVSVTKTSDPPQAPIASVVTEAVFWYERGEWGDCRPPANFLPAIDAAIAKAVCYHCREVHYGLEVAKPLAREEG